RIVEQTLALEHADCITVCGNDFNVNTLRYSGKPIYKLPQAPPVVYSWPDDKEFGSCRANFLWFGSHGFVHKRLVGLMWKARNLRRWLRSVWGWSILLALKQEEGM